MSHKLLFFPDTPLFPFIRILQGAVIGLGAVLPGISGGVLCVIFRIYQPIMEVLSHPFRALKVHWKLLTPIFIGAALGFLGISKLLGFLLTAYEVPSICLFIGMIVGMLPSLFREAGAQGRNHFSYIGLGMGFFAVLSLLIGLKVIHWNFLPNFFSYLFCGFCLALSIIAPGMSFSTLLMPLGLYQPFVEGIGNLNFAILIPAGIGALITLILLSRFISWLMEHHYSVVFHSIIGIVMAATLVIIPFEGFTVNPIAALINALCLTSGIFIAQWLEHINQHIQN